MFFGDFQKHIWNDIPNDYETWKKNTKGSDFQSEDSLLKYIKKPQILHEDNTDHYIATDYFTDIKYICFKNMMVLDIDFYKNTNLISSINKLIDITNILTDLCFDIYSSRNGLHVFCTSRLFDYKDKETKKLMMMLNCDHNYILLSNVRGWCVRLNEKDSIKYTDKMYKFLITIGNKKKVIKRNKFLIKKHLNVID